MARARSGCIAATSADRSQRRQAIAAQRPDEISVIGLEPGIALEPLVQRSAGFEFAEELEERPRAESVDPAREAGESLGR
jgi:hypothetical protein